MARRKKTSTAEDLMDLVSMLPWWAGVALAIASYAILHKIASIPIPVASTPQEIGQLATSGIWRGLAYAGQFVLPFICGMGAIASAIRRHQRKTLIDSVSRSTAADALEGMTWREFEVLVGEGFRQRGYAVTETGGGGADGGIDLVLRKDGDKFLVQCKQWKAFKVGVTVVRELYGVMAAKGAAGGFVVTSGKFTSEAVEFSQGRNIRLVDGPALLQLIRNSPGPQTPTAEPVRAATRAPAPATDDVPVCPTCGGAMVRRVAKRGGSAGNAFWGCSSYPRCKGTRAV